MNVPLRRRFAVLLSVILTLASACATAEKKEAQFDFLTENFSGYGAEVNQDALKLGRLFDLPADFYSRYETNAAETPSAPGFEKGWLGIGMKMPDEPARDPSSGKTLPAVEVDRAFPYSPAKEAGIRGGDKIVGLNDRRFDPDSPDDLMPSFQKSVESIGAGNQARLEIIRDGVLRNIAVTLKTKPKTSAKLEPHPVLEKNRGRYADSLLYYVLKKEKLEEAFMRTAAAIRGTTTDIVSLLIKDEDYNPFRLKEVNYVMHYPMELPVVAHTMTEALRGEFNENARNLPELIRVGMEKLDLAYNVPAAKANKPSDLAEYIERLVHAIAFANKLREEALAALDEEEIEILYEEAADMLKEDPDAEKEEKTREQKLQMEKELTRFFKAALKVDLARLLAAAAHVARAIDMETLAALASRGGLSLDRIEDGWVVQREENLTLLQTPIGKVLVGGSGSNVYKESAALIIDTGGDDRYLNRAGGSGREYPFAVVIDFDGNDLYSASEDFAQGAGVLGGGFLIDLAGDDLYFAQNYSQGAGIFGAGLLVDLAGRDMYKSDAISQGAAAFGVGILAEGRGNDGYSATRFSQGFGFVKGYGALVEAEGDDRYFAGGKYPDFREPEKSYESLSQGFGLGLRPIETAAGASGGIGILADAKGNDTYIGDYFSQGASYWYALGILSDKQGHDKYIAGRYSQGAGIHLTAGILTDEAGDDEYLAYFGVSQGCGHDYAVGMLLDNGGNDRYIGGVISQGAGNDNGIGVLNDNGGDDEYYIKGLGQGRGNFNERRQLGSFGFHFDTGGGNDFYSAGGKNNRLIFKTEWGVFADTQ